jgi:hypothetical protein
MERFTLMRKLIGTFTLVLMALGLLVSSVGAAVTFDPATGTGFVGKGDVQTALILNNAQMQNTAVVFTYNATSVSEATWTCDRDAGPQTQERANITTTTTQAVASSIARVKNQITGYNLTGYSSDPIVSEEVEGPAVGSCPTGWTAIDLVVGDPVPTGGGLYVNGVLLQSQ